MKMTMNLTFEDGMNLIEAMKNVAIEHGWEAEELDECGVVEEYCHVVDAALTAMGINISIDANPSCEDEDENEDSDEDDFNFDDDEEENDPYAEYYNYSGYEDEGASEEENANINDYNAMVDFLNKVFGIYIGNAEDIATAIFNNLEELKNNKNLMIRLDTETFNKGE